MPTHLWEPESWFPCFVLMNGNNSRVAGNRFGCIWASVRNPDYVLIYHQIHLKAFSYTQALSWIKKKRCRKWSSFKCVCGQVSELTEFVAQKTAWWYIGYCFRIAGKIKEIKIKPGRHCNWDQRSKIFEGHIIIIQFFSNHFMSHYTRYWCLFRFKAWCITTNWLIQRRCVSI